ncbi:MAG: glycosyltransferase family 39 protein [Anaerolineales bacterium]
MPLHAAWFERARALHALAILEIVAAVTVAILIARFFYQNGGQLVGSDMLGYINIGFRRGLSTHMLNRYVHIYALRTLTSLFPSPLEGLRYYSAIASGLAVLLVYYSARSMSKTPQIMRGVIAVAILLGLPVVVELLLAPQIDTSAMIAVLALTAIYVRSARDDHRNPWLIRLMGLTLFLAFKTKETTLVWSLALIGLGVSNAAGFDVRKLAGNLWILLQGILASVVMFAMANWLFLREPLFGLRPSDFLGYGAIWDAVAVQRSDPFDIFTGLILPQAAIAFILFIVAGLWVRNGTSWSLRLLWLVPLALLVLLTATVNRITAGIVPRHYLPGFAMLAILGSQVAGLRLPRPAVRKTALGLLLGTIALIGTVAVIGLSFRPAWPFPSYFNAILAPVTFAAALGLILLFPKRQRMVELPVLLSLLVLTIYPIRVTYPEIARQNPLLRPNARFDPVLAFKDELGELDSATTFVSHSIVPYFSIGFDRNELRALFNVGLDMRSDRENFELGPVDANLIERLVLGDFDYALITSDDWDWMRESPQDRPEWREQYSGSVEPTGRFVLLTKLGGEDETSS